MKTVKEYTDYLFNCHFTDDSFDPEGNEEHLKTSWELFDNYTWEEIYSVWMQYLYNNCATPDDVINFVNLYFYYDAIDRKIPDPIKFISYIYYRVDMDVYWDEAGDLFDSLAIHILSNHKLINMMDDPYYRPWEDKRILTGIDHWKSGEFQP